MQSHTITNADTLEVIRICSESSIYLMGVSFIIGSLFTILVLIFLDFIRRNKQQSA